MITVGNLYVFQRHSHSPAERESIDVTLFLGPFCVRLTTLDRVIAFVP